jgi:hypothetical protein
MKYELLQSADPHYTDVNVPRSLLWLKKWILPMRMMASKRDTRRMRIVNSVLLVCISNQRLWHSHTPTPRHAESCQDEQFCRTPTLSSLAQRKITQALKLRLTGPSSVRDG